MSDTTDPRERAIKLVNSLGHAVWRRDDPIRNDVIELTRGGKLSMGEAQLAAFYLAGRRDRGKEIAELEPLLAEARRAERETERVATLNAISHYRARFGISAAVALLALEAEIRSGQHRGEET